jgi:hypothetical protein
MKPERVANDPHAPHVQLSRSALLAGLGLATAGVYGLGLVLPYGIPTLGIRPLLSFAKVNVDAPFAIVGWVLTFFVASLLYYLAWRVCRGVQPRGMWWTLTGSLALSNAVMLALYPIGAADVFDNIARGRILGVHGGNPFTEGPRDYRTDPFYRYTAWRTSPSAYGPAWEVLAAGAARLAGDNRLVNVLVFKGLGVAAYALSAVVIGWTLRRVAPERALQAVCLFAWNPVVIYETAGNGHNDIWLALCLVAAVSALAPHPSQARFVAAAALLTLGALIKFITVLAWPLVLVLAWRAETSWRRRVVMTVVLAGVSTALVLAAYAPFFASGADLLGIQRRQGMFTSSLPAVLQAQLETPLGVETSQTLTSGLALGLMLGVVAWRALAVWRARDAAWVALVRGTSMILLVYLLVACPWFQSWYVIWILPLGALLPEGHLGRLIVLTSYAAVWKSAIFDGLLMPPGAELPPRLWRETVLGPATLGLAWGYAAWLALRRLVRRDAGVGSP